MKKSPTITIEEWIEETFGKEQKKPPNSFFVEDVARVTGKSVSRCYANLREKVAHGELTVTTILCNGKSKKCYTPININKKKKK